MTEREDVPGKPRVVLADDHTLLLEALGRMLQPDFEVAALVSDGLALVEAVEKNEPDVVIVDITMPKLDGLGAAERIRAAAPDARLVFLTMHADPDLAAQALRMGASAYVLKSSAASELSRAIGEAMEGRRYLSPSIYGGGIDKLLADVPAPPTEKTLTPREVEVMRALARGLSMKEAARELGITARTVAFHKYNMMQQLGLESNADMYQYAIRHGILEG
jgi:DNA-binding NarL/FixJ family response regulator